MGTSHRFVSLVRSPRLRAALEQRAAGLLRLRGPAVPGALLVPPDLHPGAETGKRKRTETGTENEGVRHQSNQLRWMFPASKRKASFRREGCMREDSFPQVGFQVLQRQYHEFLGVPYLASPKAASECFPETGSERIERLTGAPKGKEPPALWCLECRRMCSSWLPFKTTPRNKRHPRKAASGILAQALAEKHFPDMDIEDMEIDVRLATPWLRSLPTAAGRKSRWSAPKPGDQGRFVGGFVFFRRKAKSKPLFWGSPKQHHTHLSIASSKPVTPLLVCLFFVAHFGFSGWRGTNAACHSRLRAGQGHRPSALPAWWLALESGEGPGNLKWALGNLVCLLTPRTIMCSTRRQPFLGTHVGSQNESGKDVLA